MIWRHKQRLLELAAGLIASGAIGLMVADRADAQSVFRPTPSPSINRIGPDAMRSPSISPRYPSNWTSRGDRDEDLDTGTGSDGGYAERTRVRRTKAKKKTDTAAVSRRTKQKQVQS